MYVVSVLNRIKYKNYFFFCSSGFGFTSNEVNVVTDEKGNRQKMDCGTEKGKHRSKNHKAAGM